MNNSYGNTRSENAAGRSSDILALKTFATSGNLLRNLQLALLY